MPPKKIAKSKIEFENDTDEETLLDFMQRKLNDAFVENIPLQSIRDLPTRYMYIFGALAHAVATFCFLYFTYIGYHDLTQNAFLSLDEDSGDCTYVTKQVSGVYVGDSTGNWAGVSAFQDEYGLYRLELNNFEHDDEEYTEFMNEFGSQLSVVGEGASRRGLAQNLVYWMTWQPWIIDGENVHKFGMNSDPIYVFDRSYIGGGLGKWDGNCAAQAVTSYDRANGVVAFSYDYSDFLLEPSCTSSMDPVAFGYLPEYDGDSFSIKLDVTAFATAVAVNSGVLEFHTLIKIPGLPENTITLADGSTLLTSFRYHPQYPGMIPLVCMEYTTSFDVHLFESCTIKYGNTIAYPLFHHFGSQQNRPLQCTCDDETGFSDECNRFDFLNGLLFYDISDPEVSFVAIAELITKFGGSQTALEAKAYNSSWAVGGAADANAEFLSGDWREEAYDFCRIDVLGIERNCSVVTFHLNDLNLYTVSDKYYQVNDGSCKDSFMTAGFDTLAANPPVLLTQDYYECVARPLSALFDSLGIAAGNTATMVPLGLLCLLPVLYMYLQASDKLPPKEEYTTEERRAASEALALLMLRFRDGKTRGMKQKGVLAQLTAELVQSAKVESGFPDSDDDSDDEEDELDTTGRASTASQQSPIRRSISRRGSKRKTAEELELDRKLLAQQELRHHRRSLIFIQKRGDSVDGEAAQGRSSARKSGRRSDAAALREKLKRKSALAGASNSTWGWLGFGSGDKATTNPMAHSDDVEMGPASASKRRSQIESGDILLLNYGKAVTGRRAVAAMASEEVEEFLTDLKKDMNKALSVIDVDGGVAMYRIAAKKSADLTLVPLRLFDTDELKNLFTKIFAVLTIHGAVALRLPLAAVTTTQLDRVAYIIGSKVFTGREVKDISSGDRSINTAGVSVAEIGDLSALAVAI